MLSEGDFPRNSISVSVAVGHFQAGRSYGLLHLNALDISRLSLSDNSSSGVSWMSTIPLMKAFSAARVSGCSSPT